MNFAPSLPNMAAELTHKRTFAIHVNWSPVMKVHTWMKN